MEAYEFKVSIPIEAALERMDKNIVKGIVAGKLIDRHEVRADETKKCVVSVYEKSFGGFGKSARRLVLTVTVDNFEAETRIHGMTGGGGEGSSKFDWGAADAFASAVQEALYDCRL